MSLAEALGVRSYRELFAGRETRRVVSWGLLARMPMGMSSLAFVLLVRSEGGSYTAAGIVTGAYTVASGAGAVVGGRLVDRRRPAPRAPDLRHHLCASRWPACSRSPTRVCPRRRSSVRRSWPARSRRRSGRRSG